MIRTVAGLLLGVVVPLAYWVGLWLGIAPVSTYHHWFRAAHLPEWVMWSVIPWGGIHLAIIVFNKRLFRVLLAPSMFLVVMVGSAIISSCAARAADAAWGGETTIFQIIGLTLSSLHLDAIPAATATLLGLYLSRRCKSKSLIRS